MKPFIVGVVGVEPTCDQLPFLHLIRVRGYTPICCLKVPSINAEGHFAHHVLL